MIKLSYHQKISLFHIFFVFPLFYLVSTNFDSTPTFVYNALLFMGLYLAYNFRKHFTFKNYHQFVYSFHLLIIAPLIIYIGMYKQKSNKFYFKILKYLSYITLLSHIYGFFFHKH